MSATITPSGNDLLVVLYLTGVPEDPHAIPFYQFQVVSLTTWAVTLPCIDVWDSTGGYSAPVYTVRRVPLQCYSILAFGSAAFCCRGVPCCSLHGKCAPAICHSCASLCDNYY